MRRQFKGRFTNVKKNELFIALNNGEVIEGQKFSFKEKNFVKLICPEEPNKEVAILCLHCHTPLSADSTSSLYSHVYKCKNQDEMTLPVNLAGFKERLIHEFSKMCAVDSQSFSIVSNEGFRNAINFIYQMGYLRGMSETSTGTVSKETPTIYEFLPDRRQLSAHVHNYVASLKPEFCQFVIHHIRTYGGCFTVDMTPGKKSEFLGTTVHFFDENWNLLSYPLNVVPYNDSMDSGTLLKNFIESMLAMGFNQEDLRLVIYVTDEGSNIVRALAGYERINCACHMVNVVGKHTITPYSEKFLPGELDEVTRNRLLNIENTVNMQSKIVTSVNSCPHLKHNLGTFLIKEHEIRWLSRLKSVERFISLNPKQMEMITKETSDNRECQTALNTVRVDWDILENVVEVLQPMEHATRTLEGDKAPSLNKVLPEYQTLRNHFDKFKLSSNANKKAMGQAGGAALKHKWGHVTTKYHILALMLDPLRKNELLNISGIDIKEAVKLIKEEVKKLSRSTSAAPLEQNPSPFSQFRTSNVDIIDVEVESYLDVEQQEDLSQYDDCQAFWRANEKKFSNVAKLARRILCICGNSAPCERLFSLLNRENSKYRGRIKPEKLSNLVAFVALEKFEAYRRNLCV